VPKEHVLMTAHELGEIIRGPCAHALDDFCIGELSDAALLEPVH
jgi:hypothetical protein